MSRMFNLGSHLSNDEMGTNWSGQRSSHAMEIDPQLFATLLHSHLPSRSVTCSCAVTGDFLLRYSVAAAVEENLRL